MRVGKSRRQAKIIVRRIDSRWRRAAAVAVLGALAGLVGCDVTVYSRAGDPEGTTFYVPPAAWQHADAAADSWIAYSLALATCQLREAGSAPPASVHDFECELRARRVLVRAWQSRATGHPELADDYLDSLARVEQAGLLPEYVWYYLRRDDWQRPPGLDTAAFGRWRRRNLSGHRPATRLIGYWVKARGQEKAML